MKAHSHERIISLFYDNCKQTVYSTSKDNYIIEFQIKSQNDFDTDSQ